MAENPTHRHRQVLHAPASPLVVQIGFAGSRSLYDPVQHPSLEADAFHRKVQEHLVEVLGQLPEMLGLNEHHFLCGISSAAIGADTLFIRACGERSILHRTLLPEHRQAFLSAKSESGMPDFTPAQQAEAIALLSQPHIIEERVVTTSSDRSERFAEVNLEIVRVSDVLISLTRENATPKPGGTQDLVERAKARGKSILEITVAVQDGQPHFSSQWHPHPPQEQARESIEAALR